MYNVYDVKKLMRLFWDFSETPFSVSHLLFIPQLNSKLGLVSDRVISIREHTRTPPFLVEIQGVAEPY